jgi:hypothetical protein
MWTCSDCGAAREAGQVFDAYFGGIRSRQGQGRGPVARAAETCTRWDVTDVRSRPAGRYLIKAGNGATSAPC